MKLKVIICKANKGVSAHLPELDGYVIARDTISKLKKDIREGVKFHIEGLYEEERQAWMNGEYDFEYVFKDIPTKQTLERIETGVRQYAGELQTVAFEYA